MKFLENDLNNIIGELKGFGFNKNYNLNEIHSLYDEMVVYLENELKCNASIYTQIDFKKLLRKVEVLKESIVFDYKGTIIKDYIDQINNLNWKEYIHNVFDEIYNSRSEVTRGRIYQQIDQKIENILNQKLFDRLDTRYDFSNNKGTDKKRVKTFCYYGTTKKQSYPLFTVYYEISCKKIPRNDTTCQQYELSNIDIKIQLHNDIKETDSLYDILTREAENENIIKTNEQQVARNKLEDIIQESEKAFVEAVELMKNKQDISHIQKLIEEYNKAIAVLNRD